nr:unnamed protein product [Digitaria exilis]
MDSWIHACVVVLFYREKKKQKDTTVETSILDDSKPPHLLGLLRSSMRRDAARLAKRAMFLSQIGVKITASRAEWFADMNVQEKLVSGELSLSPLVLGHFNACRLVNMAALEATGAFATSRAEPEWDGYVVSSYLSTMAMLMDREEDVHELRRRGVLSSNFSNAETLAFFKGIGQHLRPGNNFFSTLGEIDGYIRRRPVRIALHKFIYNNYRIIAAILSVVGVLASILKALYSLKRP